MRLWHDPQHGGEKKGTEWSGLVERNWVLGMTNDLMPVLSLFGCEQQSARIKDETIPYEDRAEGARSWGAQIAFLHHVNAMVYPEGHALEGQAWARFDGLMTFALSRDPIGLAVARMIGRCAPVELRQRKPTYIASPDRDDWTHNAFHCLIHYGRVGIPAVLIEWGFATSPIDRAILQASEHRPALCATAACGVGRAIELIHG